MNMCAQQSRSGNTDEAGAGAEFKDAGSRIFSSRENCTGEISQDRQR